MKKDLLFLLSVLVLFGCNKNQNHYEYSYIDSGIKTQEFNTGSYWIYENDSTTKTDSTYIYYVQHGFEDQYWGLNQYTSTEYYEMWYYNDNNTNRIPSFKERIESDCESRTVNNNVYYPVWQTIYCLDLSYPNSGIVFYDSLRIGNHIYYQVEQETSTLDSTDYYTAKSIGVVKKVVRATIDKGTWLLVRWGIK
jgi:hypothetical protein